VFASSKMSENANKFDQFMVSKLAEEMKELRNDRKHYQESVQRLEKFVIKALAEEIQEFEADKKAVVEAKVKLVAEAKEKLAQLQSDFITRSPEMVKESVSNKLTAEITQLKEDIQVARENMFGRRLFEAFANEFSISHLNESKEIAALKQAIVEKEQLIAESKQAAEEKALLVESKEREIRIIKESTERKEKLAAMLSPLNKEKSAVMMDLLESVQTDKLQSAFDKYLPAVLNNSPTVKPAPESVVPADKKVVLAEGRSVVTGDKAAIKAEADESNVIELRKLAGLK